jgi:ligand-binding sensor domain-containing protein/two-component sensor histidine kinase
LERAEGLQAPSENSWDVLASDAQGSVWIVDGRGLFRYRDRRAEMVAGNGGEYGQILSVAVGRSGAMRIGTSRGVYRLEGSGRLVRAGLVRGSVTSLLEDRDRRWWAGTWGQGVFRLGESEERWTAQDGLPDDFVRSLAEDGEGNLWIGMRGGGMGRWKNPRLLPYGVPEGLAGNYASTVAMDRANELWFGTWRGGLYRLRGERFEAQPAPVPVADFTVRALAFDREGRPWIGNWEGLFQFDGGRYRRYGTEAGSPFGRVSALLFDRAGALWVGTADRGLFVFRGGRPGSEVPAPYLSGMAVTALLEDSGGRVWVGTSLGVSIFEPGGARTEWQAELGAESVESLMEDSRGRVWATTASGSLVVLAKGRMTVLGARHGLPSHPMYRMLEDEAGSFWISSPRGILELERDALEEVLAGKRERLSLLSYGVDDGMRTIECHGLSQPAGGRAADGTLWFPTSRGFVKVRRGSGQSLGRPLVQIDEVRIGGSRVLYEGRLRLEAGARNIELQYSAVRLTNPGTIRFRYRMEGFDPAWVEAGGVRSARYNQLPPGPHRFLVQARDPAGEWGNEAWLDVEQSPRFYQTWWFVLLSGMLAGGLMLAVYRWRLHGVRTAYALVNEERNRIGREWHDTLVAGFSAISLQLEAAIGKAQDEPARSKEILEVTKKMVHHYRAEARRVIWDLQDSRLEGETLPAALRDALQRATETRGIESMLKVTGAEAELPLEMQHNILRIGQEAMSNAARHAAPSRIELTLNYGPEAIQLIVADNGRGFDYESAIGEAAGHFGLVVMHERVRRLGGTLKVTSEAGRGSTVEAVIPAPKRGRTAKRGRK